MNVFTRIQSTVLKKPTSWTLCSERAFSLKYVSIFKEDINKESCQSEKLQETSSKFHNEINHIKKEGKPSTVEGIMDPLPPLLTQKPFDDTTVFSVELDNARMLKASVLHNRRLKGQVPAKPTIKSLSFLAVANNNSESWQNSVKVKKRNDNERSQNQKEINISANKSNVSLTTSSISSQNQDSTDFFAAQSPTETLTKNLDYNKNATDKQFLELVKKACKEKTGKCIVAIVRHIRRHRPKGVSFQKAIDDNRFLSNREKLELLRWTDNQRLSKKRKNHYADSHALLGNYLSPFFNVCYYFREEDLEEHFTRGRGPGGQATNRRQQTCQLTHIPTGITVRSSKSTSLHRNRQLARELLNVRLEWQLLGEDSLLGKVEKGKALQKQKMWELRAQLEREGETKLDEELHRHDLLKFFLNSKGKTIPLVLCHWLKGKYNSRGCDDLNKDNTKSKILEVINNNYNDISNIQDIFKMSSSSLWEFWVNVFHCHWESPLLVPIYCSATEKDQEPLVYFGWAIGASEKISSIFCYCFPLFVNLHKGISSTMSCEKDIIDDCDDETIIATGEQCEVKEQEKKIEGSERMDFNEDIEEQKTDQNKEHECVTVEDIILEDLLLDKKEEVIVSQHAEQEQKEDLEDFSILKKNDSEVNITEQSLETLTSSFFFSRQAKQEFLYNAYLFNRGQVQKITKNSECQHNIKLLIFSFFEMFGLKLENLKECGGKNNQKNCDGDDKRKEMFAVYPDGLNWLMNRDHLFEKDMESGGDKLNDVAAVMIPHVLLSIRDTGNEEIAYAFVEWVKKCAEKSTNEAWAITLLEIID